MGKSNPITEMRIIPQRGEVMLYLSLSEIENMSPWEALKLSESLGFKPQLRYRTWEEEGSAQVAVYALLHYEQRDYDDGIAADYLLEELEALRKIQPDTAVRFAYRLRLGRLAEAA